MKGFAKLIATASLLCAAPLVQACDVMYHGGYGGDIFKEMDKNGDGVVSKKEFDAFQHAYFKAMDANHDGLLSKNEAEIGMPEIFTRFDEFDANKDGKLSKEEIASGLKKLHENMPAKPAETINPEKP